MIALSSGEAESYGLVKGAAQGLGMKSMLGEVGIDVKVTVKTDAAAAKGIASRRGMGKVRHIEMNQLWVQEKLLKEVFVLKIGTDEHLAEHLTKYLNSEGVTSHMYGTNQWIDTGRHDLMPGVTE